MSFPVALAICENDLRRDLSFLKAFADAKIDLRVTPLYSGGLNAKVARLLKRQIDAATEVGLYPQAIIVHQDVDRANFEVRRAEAERWFQRSGFGKGNMKLVACMPVPCTERWLCAALDLKIKGAKPSAGCDPWKEGWIRGLEPDLDRVRRAAEYARDKLASLEDYSSFFESWKGAGLEPVV